MLNPVFTAPVASLLTLDTRSAVARMIPRLDLRDSLPRFQTALCVLLVLWGLCDPETGDTCEAFTNDELAVECGVTPTVLQRVLCGLRLAGLITSRGVRSPARTARRRIHHVTLFDYVAAHRSSARPVDAPVPPATPDTPAVHEPVVQAPQQDELSADDDPNDRGFIALCRAAAQATGREPFVFLNQHPATCTDEQWCYYHNCWAAYFRAIGRRQPCRAEFLAEMGWRDELPERLDAEARAYEAVLGSDSQSIPAKDVDRAASAIRAIVSNYRPEDFDDGAAAARALARTEDSAPATALDAIRAMDDMSTDDPQALDLVMRVGALDPGRG